MAWHQIIYRTCVCRCQLFLPALLSASRLVETWSSLVPDGVSGIEHSASPVLRRGTVCRRIFVLHQHSVLSKTGERNIKNPRTRTHTLLYTRLILDLMRPLVNHWSFPFSLTPLTVWPLAGLQQPHRHEPAIHPIYSYARCSSCHNSPCFQAQNILACRLGWPTLII